MLWGCCWIFLPRSQSLHRYFVHWHFGLGILFKSSLISVSFASWHMGAVQKSRTSFLSVFIKIFLTDINHHIKLLICLNQDQPPSNHLNNTNINHSILKTCILGFKHFKIFWQISTTTIRHLEKLGDLYSCLPCPRHQGSTTGVWSFLKPRHAGWEGWRCASGLKDMT